MPRERDQRDTFFERIFFALLLGVLCYGPLALGGVRAGDFLVLQGGTVLLLAVWAARVWFVPGTRLLWPPFAWVVIAFCGYAVARYFTADIEYVARQEVLRVLVYGAICLAVLNNVTRRETVQWLSLALVVLGAGIAAYAMYQWGVKSEKVWNIVRPAVYAGRGSGTYICPNHLAGFLELVLPLGLAFAIAGRGGLIGRMLIGYASLLIGGGIVVSLSRMGWAATAAALMLFFLLKIRNRRYRWPALAALVVVIAAGIFAVQRSDVTGRRGSEKSLFTHEHGSGTVRAQIWQAAFAMWRDHPWLGVGPAHFDARYPQYRLPTVSVQARPDRVHNDYLNTLADWGIIGFALVALAWVLVFAAAFRVWKYIQRPVGDLALGEADRSPGQSNRTAFVSGAVAGLAALTFHSLFDFNMHIPANAILAVTLMALLIGHLRFATDRWWCPAGWSRLIVTVLAAGLVVVLVATGVRRGAETVALKSAGRAQDAPFAERLEAWRRAAAIEPANGETAFMIGELLRLQSWEGGEGYAQLATAAVEWFEHASRLNPHSPTPPLRLGMCMVWIDQAEKATPLFDRAGQLDPNGFHTLALRGWHQYHAGRVDEAKKLFERSLELSQAGLQNPIPRAYLDLIERRGKEPPSLLERR